MSLLLQDVRLGLPFPDEQLSQLGRAKGKPLARLVHGNKVDVVLRYAEILYLGKVWQLVDEEEAVGEACHQELRLGMELGAGNVSIVLHEEVALGNAPLEVLVIFIVGVFWRIIAQHVLPHEERPVLADCVYGFLVLGEPCADDGLSVSAQRSLGTAIFLVHAPYAGRQILGCAQEEARVGGPFDALDHVIVAGVYSVPHKRRKFQVAFCYVWCGWRVPYFDLAANAYCEMPARGGEGQGCDVVAEGEVVEKDASWDIGEDGATVFVDGEEQVPAGVQCQAGDVLSVRKRQGI